jgi:hypothetical protein
MESEWLREALRFSLKATMYTSSLADDKGPPEQRDPKLRKLVEGILYSRKFVPTYNSVILHLLVVVGAVHWCGEVVRRRTRRSTRGRGLSVVEAYDGEEATIKGSESRRGSEEAFEGMSSSRSSTLEGTASPNRKNIDEDEDEETPLLHEGHTLRPDRPRISIICYCKAFLMYQPRPILFFNKILPSNGMSIVVLGLFGLNVFYSFFHINFTIFELFVLADRFGLVFVTNLPLLYLLAAKNTP